MAKIYGELEEAQLEITTSDAAGGKTGKVTWNKTDGQAKADDGSTVSNLLRNDQKAIFGTDGSAVNNIRFNRSANGQISIVTANDSTAEGVWSGTLAELASVIANFTEGGKPLANSVPAGTPIYNTSTNSVEISDGSNWQPIGSGSGGALITDVMAGEDIPTGGRPVFLRQRDYITISASNNNIPLQVSAVAYNATIPSGTYLLDTDENIAEFKAVVDQAIVDEAIGGITIVITFDQSTRNFTFSAGTNFDLLLNTNQTNTAMATLGYSLAGDSLAATSHEADDQIDDTMSQREFVFQAYTDYNFISQSTIGWVVDSALSKYDTGTIYVNGEKVVTGLNAGKTSGTLYTASASIVIQTGVNDALDWKDDGGAEIQSTISAGTYIYPYTTLCEEVDLQLTTDGANGYTVSYDKDLDVITASTDSTSIQFLPATGTNTATSCGPIIGFDADSAVAASITSDNRIDLKGRVVNVSDTDNKSVPIGICVEAASDKYYFQRGTDTSYIDVLLDPNLWEVDPSSNEKDYTADIVPAWEASLPDGHAVRLVGKPTTGLLHMQYRLTHGTAWLDSASTLDTTISGASSTLNNNWVLGYHEVPWIAMSDAGNVVIAFSKYNNSTSQTEVWAAHSTNYGVTYAECNGAALRAGAGNSYMVGGLAVRKDKAVILINDAGAADSVIKIATNSGGFGTFAANVATSTTDFQHDYACAVAIQDHTATQSSPDDYRIIVAGSQDPDADIDIVYFKSDGTSATLLSNVMNSGSVDGRVHSFGMDKQGTGNRFFMTGYAETAGNVLHQIESNDSDASFSVSNHSDHDILSSTVTLDKVNGFTSAASHTMCWGIKNRAILLGSHAYTLFADTTGNLYLGYSKSVTGGTWETQIKVMDFAITGTLAQEYQMFYMEASNEIHIVYKQIDAIASNFTKGQYWATVARLATDGTPSVDDTHVSLDNGTAMANGQQSFLTLSASASSASVSWERDDGGANNVWWTNKLV